MNRFRTRVRETEGHPIDTESGASLVARGMFVARELVGAGWELVGAGGAEVGAGCWFRSGVRLSTGHRGVDKGG